MTVSVKQPTHTNTILAYLFRPIYFSLKRYYLIRKWFNHSDDRRFYWKWEKINYNRIAVVNLLISKKQDPAYLEIGCASNDLFDSIPVLNKVGVDPSTGGTIRMTSDDFFKQNNDHFDIIFIDGLHTYQQVRNDVINAIKFLNKGGWIALHDMLPRDWTEHHVPAVSPTVSNKYPWTGDVWKVAFELSKTEGIDFRIIMVDYGVGVFRVANENVILKDMVAELFDKEFSYFYDNINSLPLVNWEDAQQWLRS